ncbi:MAG TPA: porin family protein [Cyclobacteriaceae bacterium]
MKNSIILLIVILTSSISVSGQGFELGLKGGLNLANQDITGGGISLDTENRLGYHGGLYAVVDAGILAIQPELLFSSQGSEFSVGGISDLTNNFTYVNIPVLLRYNFAFLNLHFGPQIGFLLNAEQDQVISGVVNNEVDIKDQLKNSDFSLAFGIGIDLPFRLNATVRYNLGLSDIGDDDDLGEINNNFLMLSVGFKLLGVGK